MGAGSGCHPAPSARAAERRARHPHRALEIWPADNGGANGVGSALASSDERLPGADGNRWVSDVGLPLDSDWVDAETGRAVFRELLTLPSVHPVLHEILADEKWGHVLPSIPPELRSGWRLDHDYIEFVS